jgi:hypothetical protein
MELSGADIMLSIPVKKKTTLLGETEEEDDWLTVNAQNVPGLKEIFQLDIDEQEKLEKVQELVTRHFELKKRSPVLKRECWYDATRPWQAKATMRVL